MVELRARGLLVRLPTCRHILCLHCALALLRWAKKYDVSYIRCPLCRCEVHMLRRCFNGNRNEDEEIDVRVAAVEQAREDEEARQRVAAAAREQQKQQQIAAQAQEEAAAKEKLLSGELRSLQQRTALVKVLRTIQAGGREPRAAAAAGHFRRAEVDHQHLAGVGEMGFPVVAAMCGACVRCGQEEGGAKYAAKCARNAVFDILEM